MSEIFEEVKARLNIRQVVEFYGCKVDRHNKFTCPFHSDKHPSASIKNDYFYCFACGTGGDLIKFTALMFNLSNFEACKRLIDDFNLNISINEPMTPLSRLKADRARAKRIQQQREAEQLDKLVAHTAKVLAEWHYYLWAGKNCDIDSDRFIESMQQLPMSEYYLDCYDEQPQEFSIKYRKQVAEIERKLHQCNY